MKLSFSGIYCALSLAMLIPCTAPALTFKATVLDCSGHPAVGTAELQEIYAVNGLPRFRNACSHLLDSAGNFSCGSTRPGRYEVLLRIAPSATEQPDALPTPLLAHGDQEDGPIAVREADSGTAHTLHVCASATVPVRASFAEEKLSSSYLHLAFVIPEGEMPVGVSPSYNADTGKVSLPALAPGLYHLQAYWYAGETDRRYDRYLRVPDDVRGGIVLESSSYAVSGTVRVEGGGSLPAESTVTADCGQIGSIKQHSQHLQSDGSFIFTDLESPECRFTLGNSEAVSSIELTGKAVPFGRALLDPDVRKNRLEVVLSAGRGSLSGHVGGKGAATGNAVIACSLGSGDCWNAKADADGQFHIEGLPTGAYQVSAWPSLDGLPFRDLAFIRRYQASEGEVQIQSGQIRNISLALSKPPA